MITIAILTHNHQTLIADALESAQWSDEVIIIDQGSTDHTLAIAATFPNVKIFHAEKREKISSYHQATRLATHDWIFFLNPDERISPELLKELEGLLPDIAKFYQVPLHFYFNGKRIHHCGWSSQKETRLINRKHGEFVEEWGHPVFKSSDEKPAHLKFPVLCYSSTSLHDLIKKIQVESDHFAEHHRYTRSISLWTAIRKGMWAFFKSYIFQAGFLEGSEGFVISLYQAQKIYYSYLKVQELNQDRPRTEAEQISDET